MWCIRVGRLHLERVTGFYRLNDPDDASEGAAVWARRSKSLIVENAQTGTTYTFVLADADKEVSMSNASANDALIPANADVAFPIGTCIAVLMLGAGQTSVTADTGVTLNGVSAGSANIGAQYEGIIYNRHYIVIIAYIFKPSSCTAALG